MADANVGADHETERPPGSSEGQDRPHDRPFGVATMSTSLRRLATQGAHGGASRRGAGGANEPFQLPIAPSTIFHLGTSAKAEAIFSGSRKG